MKPKVENYQKPESNYSQKQFGKTLQYVERQDAYQNREAKAIEKQSYSGRYS